MPHLVAGLITRFGDWFRCDIARPQVMDRLYLDPKELMRRFGEPRVADCRIQSTFGVMAAGLPTQLFPEIPAALASAGIARECDIVLGMDVGADITRDDHPRGRTTVANKVN